MRDKCRECAAPQHARGYCKQHYEIRRQHGTFDTWPTHPAPLARIIALTAIGITPRAVAARCDRAARQLARDIASGEAIAHAWHERHPEQFTVAIIAALYRDPAALHVNRWIVMESAPTAA